MWLSHQRSTFLLSPLLLAFNEECCAKVFPLKSQAYCIRGITLIDSLSTRLNKFGGTVSLPLSPFMQQHVARQPSLGWKTSYYPHWILVQNFFLYVKISSQQQGWTEKDIRIANILLILSQRAFAHVHCKKQLSSCWWLCLSSQLEDPTGQKQHRASGGLLSVEHENRCLHRWRMELQVWMILNLLIIWILHIHNHCSSAVPSLLAPTSHGMTSQSRKWLHRAGSASPNVKNSCNEVFSLSRREEWYMREEDFVHHDLCF